MAGVDSLNTVVLFFKSTPIKKGEEPPLLWPCISSAMAPPSLHLILLNRIRLFGT